jgi:hypothetical protein
MERSVTAQRGQARRLDCGLDKLVDPYVSPHHLEHAPKASLGDDF